jgi:hypothetical protein
MSALQALGNQVGPSLSIVRYFSAVGRRSPQEGNARDARRFLGRDFRAAKAEAVNGQPPITETRGGATQTCRLVKVKRLLDSKQWIAVLHECPRADRPLRQHDQEHDQSQN